MIIIFSIVFTLVYLIRMNGKVSRNERHKYSNKEKLSPGKDKNTSTLILSRMIATVLNCYRTSE